MAYVNNRATMAVDWLGAESHEPHIISSYLPIFTHSNNIGEIPISNYLSIMFTGKCTGNYDSFDITSRNLLLTSQSGSSSSKILEKMEFSVIVGFDENDVPIIKSLNFDPGSTVSVKIISQSPEIGGVFESDPVEGIITKTAEYTRDFIYEVTITTAPIGGNSVSFTTPPLLGSLTISCSASKFTSIFE